MKLIYLFTGFLLIFLTGCASKATSPSGISYDFWVAQKANDIDRATKYTIEQDPEKTKLYRKIKIKTVETKEPKIKQNEARVPTTLILEDVVLPQKKAQNIPVSFETVMRKENNNWKIDMFETKKNLYFAIGEQYAQNLSQQLTKELSRLMETGKSFQNVFQNVIKGLQKSLPAEK